MGPTPARTPAASATSSSTPWPAQEQYVFLEAHARGIAKLPQHQYPRHDFSEARRELEAVAAEADPDHPLGHYIRDSALSWGIAA